MWKAFRTLLERARRWVGLSSSRRPLGRPPPRRNLPAPVPRLPPRVLRLEPKAEPSESGYRPGAILGLSQEVQDPSGAAVSPPFQEAPSTVLPPVREVAVPHRTRPHGTRIMRAEDYRKPSQ